MSHPRLTERDLRDELTAAAFEQRAAEKAARENHTSRFVFAVPQVWIDTGDRVQARAVSNHPLREGEREVIAWMSYDAHDGVAYGFVPYVRRCNGEPIFADPEVFTAAVRPREQAPGWTLLCALMEDGAEPTGTERPRPHRTRSGRPSDESRVDLLATAPPQHRGGSAGARANPRGVHTGTAHLLPDDDPVARLRSLPRFNSAAVRGFGADLLTVRVDLDG